MAARSRDRRIVAAIDFGTTYSGWACSFKDDFKKDPCKVWMRPWCGHKLTSAKTPTCVLIKPDGKTVEEFGFEAECRYSELREHGDHEQWYYFHSFKMMLCKKPIHKDTMLDDECGKRLPALTVFSLSIRYMVDNALTMIQSFVSDVIFKDIHWVLTVPAIWNDSAQQFMRLSAQEAGLSKEKLTILLEPVAASMYCRQVQAQKDGRSIDSSFPNKYLVLDAGGTVAILVHEVCVGGKLKELYKSTSGTLGGALVDEAFLDFIAELAGKDILSRFKDQHKEGYMELLRNFEIKKRSANLKSEGFDIIRLPPELLDLVHEIKGQSMLHIIQNSRHANNVRLTGDKLRLRFSIIQSFFKQLIDGILTHLSTVLRKPETSGVETILLVGGYSESPLLQEAIRDEFPRMNVIVPNDAIVSVLKGAVIFGLCPVEVTVLKTHEVFRSIDRSSVASDQAPNYEDLGDSSTIEDELNAMHDLLKCKICKQRRVALTFLPCGHCITCEECGLKVQTCPMCPAAGSSVRGTVKTLFSSNLKAFGF